MEKVELYITGEIERFKAKQKRFSFFRTIFGTYEKAWFGGYVTAMENLKDFISIKREIKEDVNNKICFGSIRGFDLTEFEITKFEVDLKLKKVYVNYENIRLETFSITYDLLQAKKDGLINIDVIYKGIRRNK